MYRRRRVTTAVGPSASICVALLVVALGCGDPGPEAVIDPPTVYRTLAQMPKALTLDLGSGVQMEAFLIRVGVFRMGSDKSEFEDERPVHEVAITEPFYIGRCPVTQDQWQALMGYNPSCFQGPKHPVDGVSWEEAQVFCLRLGERTGKTVRLPTEAEWEFACRAGGTTEYCFGDGGDGLAEYAWYEVNSSRTTHPVGEKKPNAWGLCDMYGNVWEWCLDWYDPGYYADGPRVDPHGPPKSPLSAHVLRGGAWHVEAQYCRSASRGGDFPCGEGGPGSWSNAGRAGFRVVVAGTVGQSTGWTVRR